MSLRGTVAFTIGCLGMALLGGTAHAQTQPWYVQNGGGKPAAIQGWTNPPPTPAQQQAYRDYAAALNRGYRGTKLGPMPAPRVPSHRYIVRPRAGGGWIDSEGHVYR